MAVTRLSDLTIVPEVFTAAVSLRTLNVNAFVSSGISIADPEITAFLSSPVGGKTFSPRYIGPLQDTDPNISSDDPAVISTPEKITGIKNTCVRQSLNKSWSSMDLNAALYGTDPIGVISDQVGDYWATVMTKRVLASLQGVIADNITNDQSDMVVDVTGESGAAALFNPDAFIDAQTSMGDMAANLTGIAVHSYVYATMRKLDLIDFIKPSQGPAQIPTYMGLPIIQDDAMTFVPAVANPAAPKKYYTYLFGSGALALSMGNPKVPVEINRKPEAGNGGGQETLFSRQELVIHPQGFQFSLTETPTMEHLKDAANWTRAFERKRVPLACLITQG